MPMRDPTRWRARRALHNRLRLNEARWKRCCRSVERERTEIRTRARRAGEGSAVDLSYVLFADRIRRAPGTNSRDAVACTCRAV